MARYTGGWIKLYREIIDTDIGKHPARFSLLMHLISLANVAETWVEWQGKPRRCPRGSLVTSHRELASVVGTNRKMVERQLKYLQLRDTIKVETVPTGSFVTIVNYSDYQGDTTGDVQQKSNDSVADIATAVASDGAYNEELKNIRNKEIILVRNRIEKIYEEHYPKKEGKKKGVESAVRILKTVPMVDRFEKAILRYKAHLIKNKTEPKFIKQFSTFVNSWTDWDVENAGSVDINPNKHFAGERDVDHDAEIASLFNNE